MGLVGPAAVLVVVGALGPLVVLVLYSLQVLPAGGDGAGLEAYREILSDSYLRGTFGTSLWLALRVTVISLLVAVPLAFAISRARGWTRTLLTAAVVLPLLVNIVVRNLGWVLILAPSGVLNGLLEPLGLSQSLLGTTAGIGLVLVHVCIPLVVLPLLGVIDRLGENSREAATALGAHPVLAFFRIRLPGIAPGLVAGATLSFVLAVGSLVTPLFLGQGRVNVIPTMIVQQIQTFRWGRAAAMSILLFLVVVTVVVLLQRSSTRLTTGRSERSRRRAASPRRPLTALGTRLGALPAVPPAVVRVVSAGYTVLAVVFLLFPMAVIVKTAVDTSQVPQAGFDGFTLRWIGEAFSAEGYQDELLFSLRLAATALVCCLLVSSLAAWGLTRFRFPGRDAVVAFLMMPLLIPQAALAVGFVLFFLILETDPSFERLLLAHVVVTIPYMTRVLVSTFEGVDVALEEAASALGARPPTVFRRIVLPIVRSGFFTASLFGFLVSFDEAAVSVLVASGDTTTFPVKLLSDMSFQPTPVGAGISAVLIVAITLLVVPLEKRFGIASSAVAAPRR
jgi:putative spermidine/putrescine transport system permease protein